MKFNEFANYLQKLENTSKRLEITAILSDLIETLSIEEVDRAIYLALGTLKAKYENPNFNIADKMIIKALEFSFDIKAKDIQAHYGKSGDLGSVVNEISNVLDTGLTITEVYNELESLTQVSGTGSQDQKIRLLSSLLQKLDKLSAKFVVRIILGITRLGYTDLTVIDALSKFINNDKSLRKLIEEKYNIHPDIGLIAKSLKEKGMAGIKNIKIQIGIPIEAQKAQRLESSEEIIEKMGTVRAEYKFDGTRVQLHIDRKKTTKNFPLEQQSLLNDSSAMVFIKTFTRNLKETTHQFPDIVEAANIQINADSAILDGEAVGYDIKSNQFLEFQKIMQRKRKYDIEKFLKEIPLKYYVFDILYLNGMELLDKTLRERRVLLESILKPGGLILINDYLETSNAEELNEYFEVAKEKGLEGIVVKQPNSLYQAGARSFSWVKFKQSKSLKLNDTVDCTILGYYFGKGGRSKFGIGKFLVGIYNKKTNTYKTISKVGTGLKDEDWIYLKEVADKLKIKEKPKNLEIDKVFFPDVWITPSIVIEAGADEISRSDKHTVGYALRFPRLIRFRPDKDSTDTTTIEEIKHLHETQKRG
ncbi:hypothetical protein A3H26_01720 [candidate division WWE3 bacterium RIFCSPLOWO2_12_FULL_36_10]|uniref:Probable DNA ligase n=1 Tax=candidate division WWE3 bacterium RIFCSPLOWO2_12_FULL_36_10 TaxID=1802630 RepID=A0A1F4VHB0_UNCKA|nr:MAG: hypothetical protein A3H26_01720 [candidate division WWE3 bacterium RIFCSPLOWO2_12_FULL_36_10]